MSYGGYGPPQAQSYGAPQSQGYGPPQQYGPPHQGSAQGQGYPPHQQSSYPPPPHSPVPPSNPNHGLPPDWIAEWDAPDNRWFYVNQRTGERTWDRPGSHPPGPPPGGPPGQYANATGRAPMGQPYQQSQPISQAPQQKNHNMAYGAGGAVAGLAAGALLMHEGDKVKEHWERDEHKWKEDFEGRRYGDDERRDYDREEYGRGGYGGGPGGETIIENNTYVEDDRYGGAYRPQPETIINNETIIEDNGYGDRRGYDNYNETTVVDETVVRDDYGGDSGYGREEYRQDDSFVDDDASRWTGEEVQEVEYIPEDVEDAVDLGDDLRDEGYRNATDLI